MCVFFFKQKTAYEMRISDWSSDVCSSDLPTDEEPFMNPMQCEYFRQKLLAWRSELLQESTETLQHLQEESLAEPDIADRASLETDRSLELRTQIGRASCRARVYQYV